jgi:hypothetical protein
VVPAGCVLDKLPAEISPSVNNFFVLFFTKPLILLTGRLNTAFSNSLLEPLYWNLKGLCSDLTNTVGAFCNNVQPCRGPAEVDDKNLTFCSSVTGYS